MLILSKQKKNAAMGGQRKEKYSIKYSVTLFKIICNCCQSSQKTYMIFV